MGTVTRAPFGDLVRRYRRHADLTQEALAERAGLSIRAVQAIEAGSKHRPRHHTVQSLVEALALPADEQPSFRAAARQLGPEAHAGDGDRTRPHRATCSVRLPDTPTPFIGRRCEANELVGLFRDAQVRLVTLTGPGGVGKTRLALRAAGALLDVFHDGVFFCDLSPLSDPGLVPAAIAGSLDVQEEPGRSLFDSLCACLIDRHLLLLLDTCERVRGAAPQIGHLLDRCRGLSILATSRIPLHLAREREYLVTPLPVPDRNPLPPLEQIIQNDAVALFVDRAGAVQRGFAVSAETGPTIAEVCRRLDGLPLAIELAAARIKLFPPQALLQRLDHRLTLLTDGACDRPARQRTLRNTIDWSYSLLAEEERILFARLSVFVGGCTLEAVEEVCNATGDIDVLARVASLIEWGLVRQEGEDEPRFRMLDTIQEYAAEKLSGSGEAAGLAAQHAVYFSRLAEEAEETLRGAEQAICLERLGREDENLRAALRWSLECGSELGLRLAGALWRFWHHASRFTEGEAWLERALAVTAAGAGDAAVRAKALHGAGAMALAQGEYARARERHEEALWLRRRLGDVAGIATAVNNLANVAKGQGEYERARELYEESLGLNQQAGDRRGISGACANLGLLATFQGEYDRAADLHGQSLRLAREVGDTWAIAASLSYLADVATRQKDYARARDLLEESLCLERELGNKAGIGIALGGLGLVAAREGNDERAVGLYEESLRLQREVRARPGTAVVLGNFGDLALRRGDVERARSLHEESLRLYRDLGSKDGMARELVGLAGVAAFCRKHDRATQLLAAAEAIFTKIKSVASPFERGCMERLSEESRRLLGADRYEALWSTGAAMPLEKAAAYALGEGW